jgi:hypothetical protein
MERVSEKEFEIPKDVKEITVHALIDKIITPLNLTYDELIHRTKLIGMSLPEGISFNEAYVSWLSNSSFSDSIWLNFHHETLDKIAKHYNVKEDDVKYLWKDLIAKSDFYSLFHSKLEEIARPYSKYMFNTTQEIYSPECKYPKTQVENWILNAAQHLIPQDWINHSFNAFNFEVSVFNPFFQAFASPQQEAVPEMANPFAFAKPPEAPAPAPSPYQPIEGGPRRGPAERGMVPATTASMGSFRPVEASSATPTSTAMARRPDEYKPVNIRTGGLASLRRK